MTGTPSGLSERTPTVDKTASTEIVARRIEVFKAALAEVGLAPAVVFADPTPEKPHHFCFSAFANQEHRRFAYRASVLAGIAAPTPDKDKACCWRCWSTQQYDGCLRVTHQEALQFSSCDKARGR